MPATRRGGFGRVWRENGHGNKTEASLLERAKRFLKAELAGADVGYRELAERLAKHGLAETEASIANKYQSGDILGDIFVGYTECD